MLQPPLSILGNCCSILAGLPLALIARHDWDLRCAARLIGHTPKYASVTAHMRDTLHWLSVVPDSCSGGRCLLLVVFQQDGQLDAELGPTGYIQPLRPSFFCNRQNSGSSWSYNWAALLFFHCRPLHLEWILARD